MYNYTSKMMENVTQVKDKLSPNIKEKLQSFKDSMPEEMKQKLQTIKDSMPEEMKQKINQLKLKSPSEILPDVLDLAKSIQPEQMSKMFEFTSELTQKVKNTEHSDIHNTDNKTEDLNPPYYDTFISSNNSEFILEDRHFVNILKIGNYIEKILNWINPKYLKYIFAFIILSISMFLIDPYH